MIDKKNLIQKPTQGEFITASSSKGKEVVRSNHSEKLELIKSSLDNFQFSEITQEKIEKKINKTADSFEMKGYEKFGMGTNTALMSNIPIFGMLATLSSTEMAKDRYRQEAKEKMPVVVRKLVNLAISDLEKQKKELVDNLTDLSKEVRERENGLLAEIDKLTRELLKMDKQKQRLEEDVDNYKKIEQERRQKIVEALEKGYTIKSKEAVDLESLKDENKELREKLETWSEIIAELPTLKKGYDTEIQNLKHQIEEEKDNLELKQQELDNAIENLVARNEELKAETQAKRDLEKEKIDWETERKNKKEKIANLKKKVGDLEKELKKHEPSMLYQVAEKLGIIQLKNSISNVLIIAGAVVVLYAISWMWKYLVKPTYRNFKSDDEEEPRPRKKEKVRYEDYEEIVESKEKPQSLPEKQPTIIINNSTPAEKKPNSPAMVSKEPVKPKEILTQISDEKTEIEKPAANSRKNGSKKKKKNKKKVKGDSS